MPALGAGFTHAVFMPDVANVRNPRLGKALTAALRQMPNVQVLERSPVRAFLRDGERVVGVRTDDRELRAERVVVAAGAWSGELLATLGITLPVEPVKGQMILFKCAADFLPSMVLARGRYAIPRRDGHVLVGSTLEHAGFDKTPTEDALASLRASAAELLPALGKAEVVRHWAGLRPGSPEGIPYIGEVPGHEGLWLNCGHYRNGLVLAPASCRLLADLVLGREPIVDPAPYVRPGGLFRACAACGSALLWEAAPVPDGLAAFTTSLWIAPPGGDGRHRLPEERGWPAFPHPALRATFSRRKKGKARRHRPPWQARPRGECGWASQPGSARVGRAKRTGRVTTRGRTAKLRHLRALAGASLNRGIRGEENHFLGRPRRTGLFH